MIEFKKTDEDNLDMVSYRIRNDHLTLNEIVQEFRYFLLALGYHPESVEKIIEGE